jgi:hypothetical protein
MVSICWSSFKLWLTGSRYINLSIPPLEEQKTSQQLAIINVWIWPDSLCIKINIIVWQYFRLVQRCLECCLHIFAVLAKSTTKNTGKHYFIFPWPSLYIFQPTSECCHNKYYRAISMVGRIGYKKKTTKPWSSHGQSRYFCCIGLSNVSTVVIAAEIRSSIC